MAGTQINQNQINLGSETAVDLLAMQNGWKKEMITAMNNKIANYASDADTMNTVVQKFTGLTGSTPNSVYRVVRGLEDYYGNRALIRIFTRMPQDTNNVWEMTICKLFATADNDKRIITDPNSGKACPRLNLKNDEGLFTLEIPVKKEDNPSEVEMISFTGNYATFDYSPFHIYWFKIGYSAEGKYYLEISNDGENYITVIEQSSARKCHCSYMGYDYGDDRYGFLFPAYGRFGDALFVSETKVSIDGNTVFDGNAGNLSFSENGDVFITDKGVLLSDAISHCGLYD